MIERKQCCPKCGGTSGYEYDLYSAVRMGASGWTSDDEPEAGGDSHRIGGSGVSLFECIDCGAKVRESTVRAIRFGTQDEGRK
ncbi:hypothetical protein AOT14_34240 [Stenotrophomonas acidaminiphila]|uniref:Uncharacterized protein n=1 Tax=Stenotrophomonas acidaminiphila TaxID=128780 RepID=A0A0S1B441_9GAMM|nr:hypothetical protein [Stenotrophomonas acidaminiphila]ALJ29763.1 hypothetical protein AOT14_34240 [Stenotrophomonas acidaminiphila]